MTESIMSVNAVQALILSVFKTDRVRVRGDGRSITIESADKKEYACPLLGTAAGSTLTVERFLEMMREGR